MMNVGCRLSGLVVKCSRAKPVGPGFEPRVVRDRGCALLRSPVPGRDGRPVLPGFQWWSRGRGCALPRSPILGRNGCTTLPDFPWWS
ncbi:unnamed protein product, partial [Schistosoma margrebowiei]